MAKLKVKRIIAGGRARGTTFTGGGDLKRGRDGRLQGIESTGMYKAARKAGMSKEQARGAARDVRRGAGGFSALPVAKRRKRGGARGRRR